MRNYETCIMEILEGDTPRQKYDSLIKMMANLQNLKTFFESLRDTPDSANLKNIRSFTDYYGESLGVKPKLTT